MSAPASPPSGRRSSRAPCPETNWFYTLGSASTILAMLQVITGMLLTIYYVPSPDHAYESIQFIMNEGRSAG
jgi:quinol-cytochrome oxidoreductase complex cytochrome b subunit